MTNELGTTLQDIEAKAERKREAMDAIDKIKYNIEMILENEWQDVASADQTYAYDMAVTANSFTQTIRKYIEEN